MKSIRSLLALSLLYAGMSVADAVPANPEPRQYHQPDGTTVTLRLVGDEYYHYFVTDDDQMVLEKDGGYYFAENSGRSVRPSNMLATDSKARDKAGRAFVKALDRTALVGNMRREAQQARSARAVDDTKPLRTAAATDTTSTWSGSEIGRVAKSNFPLSGSPHLCVILVEFEDVKFTIDNPHDYFNRFANEPGFDDAGMNPQSTGTPNPDFVPIGSAKDYFIDNSQGRFTPVFDVYGPVTLPNPESYYGGNSSSSHGSDIRPHLMVRDAVRILDEEVDFSLYDEEGDGKIDMVYVIFAGLGEANGGATTTIWPHAWYVKTGGGISYYADGKLLDRYACSSELYYHIDDYYAADGIGTFCHEFSHVLGLPDEYDTSYGDAYTGGLTPGTYSVLDTGSYNCNGRRPPAYCSYQRNALGWADIEVLQPDVLREVTLPELQQSNKALAIETKDLPDGSVNEFFLFENRQNTRWDKGLPGHGMLVWHITYKYGSWELNKPNNNSKLLGINLVSANGTPKVRAGRPFPGTGGITSFTSSTTPPLATNGGTGIEIPITEIAEDISAGLITFKVCDGIDQMEYANLDRYYFDFSGDTAYGMTPATDDEPAYNDDGYVCEGENVTMTLGGRTGWWNDDAGNELRFFEGSTFTLEAADGYRIIRARIIPTAEGDSLPSFNQTRFSGFDDVVTFQVGDTGEAASVASVKVGLVAVPQFYLAGVETLTEGGNVSLQCLINHTNSQHVVAYRIWVEELQSASGSPRKMETETESGDVGRTEVTGDEISDGPFWVNVPLTIATQTGTHHVGVHAEAVVTGNYVVGPMAGAQGRAGDGYGDYVLDTDEGIVTGLHDAFDAGRDAGEENQAVYYNMQGIRLTSPAAGEPIIKVQGHRATKIILKKV